MQESCFSFLQNVFRHLFINLLKFITSFIISKIDYIFVVVGVISKHLSKVEQLEHAQHCIF